MTTQDTPDSLDQQPPAMALYELIDGFARTQCISVVARLGIADALKSGAKSVDELSKSVEAHPRALLRVLRAVASLGIFAEMEDGTFELTPLAETLQSDVPGSMREFAIMYGQEWYWKPWGALFESVKTGDNPFMHVHGNDLFGYLNKDVEAASIFNGAMTSITSQGVEPILNFYDFSRVSKIIDVGGGHGTLITAILESCPSAQGLLFDLPSVAEGAKSLIESRGLSDRCQVVGGDFFESVPSGGDVYILKFVIHDWDDERTVAILKNCRPLQHGWI